MNWKLIAPLAIVGPIMGGLVVMGAFPPGTDRFAWAAIVLASAFFVARREPAHALKHGFVIGLWNGAVATLVQAFFLKPMLANNPWMAAKFANAPKGFDMEFFVFMLVPFIGVAGGGLTAFVAVLFRRALASKRGGLQGGQTHP
jgi:hypothetical protein